MLGPERPLLLTPRGSRAHRLSRGRPRDPRPGRARRRSGAPRDDRAARPGARRDLPAPADRSLQLSRRRTCARASSACWAAAPPRRSSTARKTTGAESDIEQATQPRAQHGHALGHERRARAWCSSRRAQNPYLGGVGRVRRREAVQRGDRARRSTPKCSGSSTRATSEAKRLLTQHRTQLDALVAGAARARDARRARSPRGHRASARACSRAVASRLRRTLPRRSAARKTGFLRRGWLANFSVLVDAVAPSAGSEQ